MARMSRRSCSRALLGQLAPVMSFNMLRATLRKQLQLIHSIAVVRPPRTSQPMPKMPITSQT